MMMSGKGLFRLTLGFCLLTCYVHAIPLKLFGGGLFNPNEDMMPRLEQQKQEKERLQIELKTTNNVEDKSNILRELQKVDEAIANMESSYKIVYRDHLDEIAELTEKFQYEKENLRTKKEIVEYAMEKQSLEALAEKNKDTIEQIGKFEEKMKKLEEDLKIISDPIEAYAKLIQQQQEDMKQQKEQLEMEGEEIAKKIKEFQDRSMNSKSLN